MKAEEEDDGDDSSQKKATEKPRRKKVKEEEVSIAETSKPKKVGRGKKESVKEEGKDGSSPVKGKGRKKEKKEEDVEVYKWWEQTDANGDGSVKWMTLEHYGVFFPPPYEPLPSNIKMIYDGMFPSYNLSLSC